MPRAETSDDVAVRIVNGTAAGGVVRDPRRMAEHLLDLADRWRREADAAVAHGPIQGARELAHAILAALGEPESVQPSVQRL